MPGGNVMNILLLVLLVGAFYLLIIRPQQVQRKKHDEIVAALAPGVRVMTIGGLYGTVVSVRDEDLVVEIADGVQIEMIRGAVAKIADDGDGAVDAPVDEDHSDHDDPMIEGAEDEVKDES